MTGRYRLLRTRAGITSFATVTVVSTPEQALRISWDASLADLQRIYGPFVQEGVEAAFRQHLKLGGDPQAVRVTDLAETAVDTKPDAVRCAASIAAWKSWGHSETEVTLTNDQGEWVVVFMAASGGE